MTGGGINVTSQCPKCVIERDAAKKVQEQFILEQEIRARIHDAGIPKRFRGKTIPNLVLNPKMKKTVKAVQKYAVTVKDGEGFGCSLIMCGKPGTGKTHIGCALVIAMCQVMRSRYVTVSALMRDVKSTYRQNSDRHEEDVLHFWGSEIGFLVIDEVGVQFGTETEKLIFYEIINRRYENMLPTVLISNLDLDELTDFVGERVIDRFMEDGGAVLPFNWESYRRR